MDKATLVTCIELVELDQKILQINHESAHIVVERQQLIASKDAFGLSLEQAKQKVHDAKKSVDAVELELKVAASQLSKIEGKLRLANNQKEIDALSVELRDVTSKKSTLEDRGLELISQLEEVSKVLSKMQEDKLEQENKMQETLVQLDKRHEHVQALGLSYLQKRDSIAQKVPQEFMAQYEVMRQRVANPVVPVLNASCSGCFYALSKPDLIKAEQGQLISCTGCYRLLYIFKSLRDSQHDEHYVS